MSCDRGGYYISNGTASRDRRELPSGEQKEPLLSKQDALDIMMMRRCVALSRAAGHKGELPFASLICKGTEVLVEATNENTLDLDTTRHAELIALSKAQRQTGSDNLEGYTLYSNVEPCVMCSLSIRETRISRLVYSLESPLMGGNTKWPILRDEALSNAMPEAFGYPPDIVSGLLAEEAAKAWHDWNPLIWHVVRGRGCFHTAPFTRWQAPAHQTPLLRRAIWRTWHHIRHLLAVRRKATSG